MSDSMCLSQRIGIQGRGRWTGEAYGSVDRDLLSQRVEPVDHLDWALLAAAGEPGGQGGFDGPPVCLCNLVRPKEERSRQTHLAQGKFVAVRTQLPRPDSFASRICCSWVSFMLIRLRL